MAGCLLVASGVAVQRRAHQSVDASVAGQPRVKLPVLDYAVHAVQSCQGRAPKCEDSQGRLSLGAAVEPTAYWRCEWCSLKKQADSACISGVSRSAYISGVSRFSFQTQLRRRRGGEQAARSREVSG